MNARLHSRPRSLEQEPGSRQEEIWSQFRAVLKQELKTMVEQALEEELTEYLAARAHERPRSHCYSPPQSAQADEDGPSPAAQVCPTHLFSFR